MAAQRVISELPGTPGAHAGGDGRDLKHTGAETVVRKKRGYRAQLVAKQAAREREELAKLRNLKPSAVMQRWAFYRQPLGLLKPQGFGTNGDRGDGDVFDGWCYAVVESALASSVKAHGRILAARLVRSCFMDGKPSFAELGGRSWFVALECAVVARMQSHPFRPDAGIDWGAT